LGDPYVLRRTTEPRANRIGAHGDQHAVAARGIFQTHQAERFPVWDPKGVIGLKANEEPRKIGLQSLGLFAFPKQAAQFRQQVAGDKFAG